MAIIKYAVSYRLLAFLAISCSIAMVARVSGDPLLLGVGVAGLATGNIYIWRTDYTVSRLRTGVLLLLLIILLFYLGRDMLFTWTNDPLLLARYLVFGLIVSSFDLRTRRNVLGTLILSGMLFVLLSQMAFDLWFPVLMGMFVLLALAAAMVGNIQEDAGQTVVVGEGSRPSAGIVGIGFAFGFILLAGAIFLLMPRFGFGSFAQASWLPSRIDLTAGGPTQLPSLPSASVSPGFLVTQQTGGAGAGRYVSLGYVGSAADAPVMHVRSQLVTYWRGSTLDEYDGVGWLPSVSTLALVDEGRGEFVFPDSDLRQRGRKRYSQTYYLLVDQPNAVFTGYNPGRLYLPQVGQSSLGRGSVYRAVSTLPRLNPAILRSDRVDSTDLENLVLPPISDRVAALADSIVQEASTDYDKAARLEQFLLSNYGYDLGVEPLAPGRDAVDTFLFEGQSGYCAQFATTMAVMARHVGLPARVAVGYLPGLYNPMTGAYTVRAGDAHAWVEIHFRYSGWAVFDPTPRTDINLTPGADQGWVSFGLLDVFGGNFTGAFSNISGDWFTGQLSIPSWWLAFLGAIVIGSVLAILIMLRRKTRSAQETKGYTFLAGELRRDVLDIYRKMVALLVRKGLPPRQSAQTPQEYVKLVAPYVTEGMDIVRWLTKAANVAAYDSRPLSPSMAQEARNKFAVLPQTVTITAT